MRRDWMIAAVGLLLATGAIAQQPPAGGPPPPPNRSTPLEAGELRHLPPKLETPQPPAAHS